MAILIKRVSAQDELQEVLQLRREVFTSEQQFPSGIERDFYDDVALHVCALLNGQCVGTGRAHVDTSGATVAISRVAVTRSRRRCGVGSMLIDALEIAPEFIGTNLFVLDADVSTLIFYERLGYVTFGKPFMDNGIEHRSMRKIRL